MVIHIKNMVCPRCIMAIEGLLKELGHKSVRVDLGEVELEGEELNAQQLDRLDKGLKSLGFERLDNKKARLIEKIKGIIIEHIHHAQQLELKYNWSHVLSEALHMDYNYLSNLFSSMESITLEQYIIRQKIERVKELLRYDELNLNEIAFKLGYSSVQHLSGQFKKVTGFTPSEFKRAKGEGRKPLDNI